MRSGLALLAAAPPGHRDPVPPGVSPRALAPVLWPATACCCSCGCAAPASRVHHRATAPASPACSPRRAGLAHAGLATCQVRRPPLVAPWARPRRCPPSPPCGCRRPGAAAPSPDIVARGPRRRRLLALSLNGHLNAAPIASTPASTPSPAPRRWCCPSPDLDRLLAGPRVFALFPAGRQQTSAPPLPINAGEPPRPLLLSLPSHTTAAITPRAASKLVARVVPLPMRSGLALLAAAPPGHRDPVPPGVSPRALAPVLWPATACCCSCGCAAPASRDHHHATAPVSPACSPRPCWPRPRRPGDLPGPPPSPAPLGIHLLGLRPAPAPASPVRAAPAAPEPTMALRAYDIWAPPT
nr:vegetative cell wall protein gp1-like [Aegilops tauschii subsp. strangulata]